MADYRPSKVCSRSSKPHDPTGVARRNRIFRQPPDLRLPPTVRVSSRSRNTSWHRSAGVSGQGLPGSEGTVRRVARGARSRRPVSNRACPRSVSSCCSSDPGGPFNRMLMVWSRPIQGNGATTDGAGRAETCRGATLSVSRSARACCEKSFRLAVTIRSARPYIVAASTWRSRGSGRSTRLVKSS